MMLTAGELVWKAGDEDVAADMSAVSGVITPETVDISGIS
jgi:hypothetical protein